MPKQRRCQRNGVRAAFSISLILLAAAAPVHASGLRFTEHRSATLAHCLNSHSVQSGVIPFTHTEPEFRPLLPPGLTSSVTIMAGFGPQIDGGDLYIFRTDALAKAGVEKLISTFVLFKNYPKDLAVLGALAQKPPSLAAARKLTRTDANVVLIWHYPRHRVAISDKIVNSCLARNG